MPTRRLQMEHFPCADQGTSMSARFCALQLDLTPLFPGKEMQEDNCVKGRATLTGSSNVFVFASALNWLLTTFKSRFVRVTSANLTKTQEEHFPTFPSVFAPAHYFQLI